MASDEDKTVAALAARLVELGMGALIGAAIAGQPDPRRRSLGLEQQG